MDVNNEHILKFDEILGNVVKICDKQSSRMTTNQGQEDLWKQALKIMFSTEDNVYKLLKSKHEDDIDYEPPSREEKANFHRFLSLRHQSFIQQMSEYINLKKIVSFLEDEGHNMEFKEFK